MPKSENTDTNQLLTLHRALDVLEYLGKQAKPVRLSDISTALGYQKSKVHRILSTYVERGYVRQDSDNHLYSLGMAVWQLSHSLEYTNLLIEVVKPALKTLSNEVQETTFLSTLKKDSVIYLYSCLSPNPIGVYLQKGSQTPIHSTASGKAMLSIQHQDDIEALVNAEFKRFTKNTIKDRDMLLNELENIRQQGYAIETDETQIGMSAVAVNITTQQNQPTAIGILMPTARRQGDDFNWMVEQLLKTRQQILTSFAD